MAKEQRHKGAKAQRHKGTEAQRNRGTEGQSIKGQPVGWVKPTFKQALKILVGSAIAAPPYGVAYVRLDVCANDSFPS